MSHKTLPKYPKHANHKSARGFTLIELSIVLVIIGLIVGGVLTGRELIGNAQMRKQISEFEKLNASVLSYKLKYGAIPGDDPRATSYFTNVLNGNGDGVITPFATNYFCSAVYGGEACVFWGELYQAGLWSSFSADTTTPVPTLAKQCGPGTRYPCFMERPNVGYVIESTADATGFVSTGKNHIAIISDSRAGTSTWNGGTYLYGYAAMSPNEASDFDKKMDDGTPLGGIFVARRNQHPQYHSALAQSGGGNTGDSCVTTSGGNTVYASSTTIDCVMTLDTPY